jgi:MATE family multidrug resistance protein
MINIESIKAEIKPMLRLALPLVLAELGWMAMGIVDTVMAGHLPASAISIGATALAQVLYNTLAFGFSGVLLGLDTLISQAYGAGRIEEANRWLWHGVVLAAVLAAVLTGVVLLWPLALDLMPISPQIRGLSIQMLYALNWGTPMLLVYFVLRRHLQAFNHVRVIAVALVSANLVNLFGDWLLIFPHHWGAHNFFGWGVAGSGWSTTFSRLYLALFMVSAVLRAEHREKYKLLETSLQVEWVRVRKLVSLGAPAGAQILLEVAIFGVVTAAIALLGPLQLAGHQIALDCAAFTFMVPFALSAATAVRVAQAIGRRDAAGAAASGWTGMMLGAGFMLCTSVVFLSIPRTIAHGFSPDPVVIAAAAPLLMIAAIFQFCDGLQVTASGALRGAGNTKAAMFMHGIGYWMVGLPLGAWLGFGLHWGAVGMWSGLCLALILAGIGLMMIWWRTTRRLPEIIAAAHAEGILTS